YLQVTYSNTSNRHLNYIEGHTNVGAPAARLARPPRRSNHANCWRGERVSPALLLPGDVAGGPAGILGRQDRKPARAAAFASSRGRRRTLPLASQGRISEDENLGRGQPSLDSYRQRGGRRARGRGLARPQSGRVLFCFGDRHLQSID